MPCELPEAQLAIYIKGKLTPQGKFAYIDNKPSYLANCTPAKWFKNFSGYAIAKQILEALPHGTKIIYKRSDIGQYYLANKTRFYNKGVAVNYGDHQQYVLPIKSWEFKAGKPKEKFGLPTLSISKWKNPGRPVQKSSGRFTSFQMGRHEPATEDCSMIPEVGSRLASIFFNKYPEMRRAV